MANDPELNKRLENARMRQDEYCAKRVEEADARTKKRPREEAKENASTGLPEDGGVPVSDPGVEQKP